MKGNPLLEKGLVVGIILLFVGTCIIPSTGDVTVSNGIKKGSHDSGTIGDSPPDEEWNVTYYIPSKGHAIGNCVQVTPDGGYIVTGYAGYGYWYDVYVLKVDSQGNELWNRTFGNQSTDRYDIGNWVEVTSDNGYIITGDYCRIYSDGIPSQTFLAGGSNPGNDGAAASFSLPYRYDGGLKRTSQSQMDSMFYAFDINTYPGQSVWFDPADPGTLNEIAYSSAGSFISAGTWAHDVWYVSEYFGGLYTVDPTSGDMTLIGGSTQLNGLGYVDTSGTMYGCDSTNLYTVDRSTGATTLVGPMNNAGIMIDMAVDSYGNAYGVDVIDNNLYSIDLLTGAATIIGATGYTANYAQGMGFDKNNGICYIAAFNYNTYQGELRTVDVTTGMTTLIGAFQNGAHLDGLAIPYNGVWYQYDKNVWLIKVDANGNEQWNKTYGSGEAGGSSVKQTNDGGYIVTGGDAGYLLLLKTDELGNEQWNKTYYGNYTDGISLAITTDGGYIVSGRNHYRLLLMKTDENGTVEWEKEFFADSWPGNCGNSVQQTSDGGYIVGGETFFDGASNNDLVLMKTDVNGTEEWNLTFGGSEWDWGGTVIQTIDGDYILGGTQIGLQGFISDKFWLIRTHPNGSVVWDHFYLPSLDARCYCVQQTPDNGLIATGAINVSSGPQCVVLKISGGNHPPDPSTIEGSVWGEIKKEYPFSINATDPDGDPIYCKWEWGDGNITDWLGPYSSNTTINASHAWSQKGAFEIRVRLKDKFGHENNWSDPHVFNAGESKNVFLIGRYTNITTEGEYRSVEAVNMRLILFKPVQYVHYTAGEKIAFLKNNSKAFITPRFIIGLVDALI